MQIESTPLIPDGVAAISGTVSILDDSATPPEVGSEVSLLSTTAGILINGRERTGSAVTDSVGVAQFVVSANNTVAANSTAPVYALFKSTTKACAVSNVQIGAPPDGSWSIAVASDEDRLDFNGSTQLTVTATQANGSPVPAGTRLVVSLRDSDQTAADINGSDGPVRVAATSNGQAFLTLSVGSEEQVGSRASVQVCVDFADERFGEQRCTSVRVGETKDYDCQYNYSDTKIKANGSDTATVTFAVFAPDPVEVVNAQFNATLALGTLLDADTDASLGNSVGPVVVGDDGQVEFGIQAPNTPGLAGTRASVTFANLPEPVVCRGSDIEFLAKPDCEFRSIQPEQLGVDQSGFAETGILTYCFTQADGTPLPAGEPISFRLTVTTTDTALSGTSAQTDDAGCATVQLTTGTLAGIVEAEASYQYGDSTSSCTSGGITVNGFRPTERGLNLYCSGNDGENIGALFANLRPGTVSSQCAMTCGATLRDRYSNQIRTDWPVYFASEMGVINSPTVANGSGRAVTSFIADGQIPRDVEPFPSEPRYEMPDGEVRNPRDMLVTVIAWTVGEEGFVDANGNGRYDEGEVFFDLGEPFIDANDNGVFDPGEPDGERFIDTNIPDSGNRAGVYDGPNGQWDAYTLIWTEAKIVLTGSPLLGSIEGIGGARSTQFGAAPNDDSIYPEVFSFFYAFDTDSTFAFDGDFGSPLGINGVGTTVVRYFPRDLYLNIVNPSFSAEIETIGDCDINPTVSGLDFSVNGFFKFAGMSWGRRAEPLPNAANPERYVYEPYVEDFFSRRPDDSLAQAHGSAILTTTLPDDFELPDGGCGLGFSYQLSEDSGSCSSSVDGDIVIPIEPF
jgi:hypothetical protein